MATATRLMLPVLLLLFGRTTVCSQEHIKQSMPIGIFIGRIEEGARIFTPVRLLPFDHPESEGHQFPNALQLFGTELEVVLWLGRLSGYELHATLTRYPMAPSPAWPYKEFLQPDTSGLRTAQCIRRPAADSPLKGLKAVLYVNRRAVSFIVDTRNLSLQERGMVRATSMGLDITRAEFLTALDKSSAYVADNGTEALIFAE
jgi:hypothetical protein